MILRELNTIRLTEAAAKNVVFKLEIPSGAEKLLSLKKNKQMEAIEGEEWGDGSFIQNQEIVTVEYITRVGNKIHVYPMLDGFDASKVSKIAERLQKAFNTWCLKFKGEKLKESFEGLSETSSSDVMEVGSVIGEIGEELISAQTKLHGLPMRELAELEAKHEIYLGEDIRELTYLVKKAVQVATKLNDTLMEIPVREAEEKGPRFRISWKGYGKTAPKVVSLDFFSDGNGFDADDLAEIKELIPGQDWVSGGPLDSVTVSRIK